MSSSPTSRLIKHIEIDTDNDEELIEFSDRDCDKDTAEDFFRD